ncbi:MAG: GFA family protein [Pseudorhodobacter sp.]
MKRISGHCLCGAVKVSMTPGKPELSACHCGMCQRWTGSVLMSIESEQGSLTHEGPVKIYRSSDWAERAFCAECGTSLWYHLTIPDHETHFVAAGLFPDAGGLKLDHEIYIDRKPEGYAFAGNHQKMTQAEVEAFFASLGGGDEK